MTLKQARMKTRSRKYQAQSRTRVPRNSMGALPREPVADSVHGLDQLRGPALVDLVAQVGDVDRHPVGRALEVVVPDTLRDLGLGQHLVGMPHEELEQRELAGGELDHAVAPPDLVCL